MFIVFKFAEYILRVFRSIVLMTQLIKPGHENLEKL